MPTSPSSIRFGDSTLTDAVFTQLSNAIVDGVLEPGESVRIAELSDWLGVSRTPVREALARLSVLGLVDTVPSKHTKISTIDSETVAETLEYTGYLAGVAVHMAVRKMTEDEARESLCLLDVMIEDNRRGDDGALYESSALFVAFIAARAHNRIFLRVMAETGALTRRNLRNHQPMIGSQQERDDWYTTLRSAIVERDADYAEFAFRGQHHITREAGQ
ncbi:GntR family transcriptional regulator [Microbacterium sp. A8/3-1]|uniref:GntR family transcriptional regulator n=1 Tax=Microbacterium sp. A8/3-1 TaxID=3160749 RepID=A0AAU7W544_9MICO